MLSMHLDVCEHRSEEEVHMDLMGTARRMLKRFKGDAFVFGLDCLEAVGSKTAQLGRRVLLVANPSEWLRPTVATVTESLASAGVEVVATTRGARPNAPLADTYRIQDAIEEADADCIVAVGGGSTLDAAKAAACLARLTPGVHDVHRFFGVGKVTEALHGGTVTPLVAVETAASSGSHLTKYANVTDMEAGQKKLIADPAVVPPRAVFDYSVTVSASKGLTMDGAFDGMSHCLEVYYGAKGKVLAQVESIALTGIELILSAVERAVENPKDLSAREALGLGTDLGGYCIMLGSTNGGHLTSFSLVDVTTHGRATAIMNPYYTVLFAWAIEPQLRRLAGVYQRAGLLEGEVKGLSGRELALVVAAAMKRLAELLDMPTSLTALANFSPEHIDRAVAAAKDPQLQMKLKAMPVPMDSSMVDLYMRPALEAAAEGSLEKVVTLPG